MADSSEKSPAVFRSGRNLQLVGQREVTDEPPKNDRREEELRQAIAVVRTALGVLGQRTMTLLALLAACGMFAWAVLDPNALRITAACLYAVLVFGPLAWLDARGK